MWCLFKRLLFTGLCWITLLGATREEGASECVPEDEAAADVISLDEATELAKRGELSREQRLRLVDAGKMLVSADERSVHASFFLDNLYAVIRSESTPAGEVEYSIQLGDLLFSANFSLVEMSFRINGYNNSITPKAKLFLTTLAWRMESDGWNDGSPVEQRMVYTLANMLSEMPVGYQFDSIESKISPQERAHFVGEFDISPPQTEPVSREKPPTPEDDNPLVSP